MHRAWCGLKEGVLLAVPASLALAVLGWTWSAGLWAGLLAVVAGRAVRVVLIGNLAPGPRTAVHATLGGLAAQGIMAALALGAAASDLPALAVAGGLGIGVAGMWCHVWTAYTGRGGRWTSWARS